MKGTLQINYMKGTLQMEKEPQIYFQKNILLSAKIT